MRAHLEAVRALVASGTGKTAYTLSVPANPSFPYYIVSLAYGRADDRALDGTADGADLDVRVRAVALTPDAALILADLARAALCPSGRPASVTVAGWRAEIRWLRHEADYIDPDEFDRATNTNPALSVDTYRLQATPA